MLGAVSSSVVQNWPQGNGKYNFFPPNKEV